MTDVAALNMVVTADSTQAKKNIDDVGTSTQKSGSFFSSAAGSIVGFIGAAAGITAVSSAFSFLTDQVKESVTAASNDENIQAQLNAALKSTGGSSGETAASLNALAEKLSLTTEFSKDTTLQAEEMGLRFQNIGSSVFPQVVEQAQNLSARMGIDLNSALKLVGRATDDPIKGLTALTREGVTFTTAQQDQIKAMVKSGDTMGAQGVILDALNEKFGGAAKAAGGTFAGQIVILQNSFEDLRVKIGDEIIPIMGDLLTAVTPLLTTFGQDVPIVLEKVVSIMHNDVAPAIEYVSTHLTQFEPIIIGVSVAVGVGLVAAFVSWAIAAGAAAVATIAATLPVIAIGVAIAALVAGIVWAYQNWGWFRTAVDDAGASLQRAWGVVQIGLGLLGNLAGLVGGDVGNSFHMFGNAITVVGNGFNWLGGVIHAIEADFNNLIGVARNAANAIGNIASGIGGAIGHIPGFASGTTSAPGGLALVGEGSEPELVVGPHYGILGAGTGVYPISQLGVQGGGGGGFGTQTIIFQLDNQTLAKATMRGTPKQVYIATGFRGTN